MAPEIPLLHVLAQPCPHDTAWIAGNRLGLERLRDAVTAALAAGTGAAEAFAADGEGYHLVVVSDDSLDAVPLGYTDREYRQPGPLPEWMGEIERDVLRRRC